MPSPQRKKHRSNGGCFFSSWSFDERVFLRGLYKRYACTKAHIMARFSADPHRRNDCCKWPMWTVMAGALRTSLDKYVEPRKLEAFFWHVIARGADPRTVTKRLDFLVLRNGSLSSDEETTEETDESEDVFPSDDEQNYSSYSPSADESCTTDSQESMAVDRDAITVASSSSEAGNVPVQRSRAGCGNDSGGELWIAPKEQRRPVFAPVQKAGECGANRCSELQQVAESTEDAVPVQEQDVPMVCNEIRALNGVVAELSIKDAEVCVVSGDGGSGDSSQPSQQSVSACGVAPDGADGGDGLMCSPSVASPICGDGHHSGNGTGSPPDAEATRPLVDRADKEVQCDMFSSHWADHIYREAMLRIEALKRQLSFYDEMGK